MFNKFNGFALLMLALAIAAVIYMFSFMNYSTVRPDEEAVIIDLYGKRELQVVDKPGRYHVGFGKELIRFPVRLTRVEWKEDDAIKFQSKEGLSIIGDAAFQMAFNRGSAAELIKKYGKNAPDIINTVGRDVVRETVTNVASKYTAMEINGPMRPKFTAEVNDALIKSLAKEKINVQGFMFTGQFILPEEVKQSIDAAQRATQIAVQRENELRTTRAEAEKTKIEADAKAYQVITAAKAESEANKLRQLTVTDKLIQYEIAQKWDGKNPQVVSGGNNGAIVVTPGGSFSQPVVTPPKQ